jgi:hypothetical protein
MRREPNQPPACPEVHRIPLYSAVEFQGGDTVAGLTRQEIARLVNRYIGVSGGYLGDFSYRTHAEFYPEYCDLDINPY